MAFYFKWRILFLFFLIVTQESDLPFFIIISILIFVKTIKTTVLIQSLTLTKWFAASESRPVLSHCLRSVIQVKWAVLQVIRQPAACDVFKNKDTVLKQCMLHLWTHSCAVLWKTMLYESLQFCKCCIGFEVRLCKLIPYSYGSLCSWLIMVRI